MRRIAGRTGILWAAVIATNALRAEPATPPCRIILADGQELEGTLTGAGTGGTLLLSSAGETKSIDGNRIVSVEWKSPETLSGKPDLVAHLTNGDILKGRLVKGDGQKVLVRSDAFGPVAVGVSGARDLIFEGEAVSPEARTRCRLAQEQRKTLSDTLILANGDSLQGQVKGFQDSSCLVNTEFGDLNVAFDRVHGILLASSPPAGSSDPRRLQSVFSASNGELLTGEIRSFKDGVFHAQLASGETVQIAARVLASISFRNGAVVFLSDLEPEKTVETPFFDLTFPGKKDRSVGGNELRIDGKTYRKGLGVHSKSEITFLLLGKYNRFQTDIGIDDEVGPRGNVTFLVLGDGKELFRSEDVRGGEPARTVDLDVKGIQRLTLTVDFGKEYHIADHADWAGARLLKSP